MDTAALALAEGRAQVGIVGVFAVIVGEQLALLRVLWCGIGTWQDIKRQQEQGHYGCDYFHAAKIGILVCSRIAKGGKLDKAQTKDLKGLRNRKNSLQHSHYIPLLSISGNTLRG